MKSRAIVIYIWFGLFGSRSATWLIPRVAPILAAAVLLAGCHPPRPGTAGGAGPAPPSPSGALGRPVALTPTTPARWPVARSDRASSPAASGPNPAGSWSVAPDRSLPRPDAWRPVLSLAHRFAAAFIAYQTGRFTVRIRGTIEQTCTDGLAGNLLAHQPVLSPRMVSRELNEGLESVEPLAYVAGHALVLVIVRRSVLGRDGPGACN